MVVNFGLNGIFVRCCCCCCFHSFVVYYYYCCSYYIPIEQDWLKLKDLDSLTLSVYELIHFINFHSKQLFTRASESEILGSGQLEKKLFSIKKKNKIKHKTSTEVMIRSIDSFRKFIFYGHRKRFIYRYFFIQSLSIYLLHFFIHSGVPFVFFSLSFR